MTYIRYIVFCVLVCGYGVVAGPVAAGQSGMPDPCWDSLNQFEDFFEREEPMHLVLEYDLKTFQRNRKDEPYMDARMYCVLNDSCRIPYEVRLKTRGIFRKSFCYLPPFWMNIEDASIESNALYGVEKMKIVTHCMNKDFYQDYLLKEYLAYKLYNIISPYSFRVRLLKITYMDTGRKNSTLEGWAFAIEPIELLAERLNATIIEDEELSMRMMNSEVMDRLSMFNYMIGNTDYSITGAHNVKILTLNNSEITGYIPVPYDFDFTGIVNTVYAKPAAQTSISKVTERYFTGVCRSEEIFEKVVDDFHILSPEIHQLLQSFEYMHLEEKLEMLRFIEGFFDETYSDNFVERKLRLSCK